MNDIILLSLTCLGAVLCAGLLILAIVVVIAHIGRRVEDSFIFHAPIVVWLYFRWCTRKSASECLETPMVHIVNRLGAGELHRVSFEVNKRLRELNHPVGVDWECVLRQANDLFPGCRATLHLNEANYEARLSLHLSARSHDLILSSDSTQAALEELQAFKLKFVQSC